MNKIAKEDLIEDVLNVYNRLGKISRSLYLENGKYSRKPIDRLFGSWNKMLEYLDIPINQRVNEDGFAYTDNELIDDLIRIYQEYGVCSSKLIKDDGISCLEVYTRRFGSVNKAFERANLPTRHSGESVVEKAVIQKIASILNSEYDCQKQFNWLVNPKTNKKLFLDAYFPEYNLAVEYNGRQHYEVVSFIKNDCQKMLDKRIFRDNIKYKLLNENNISLLIIRHDESVSRKHLIRRLSSLI